MVAEASRSIISDFSATILGAAFSELDPRAMVVADSPPDYVFDLIQISILAAAGDVTQLTSAVDLARQHGAENREILRAMFRSDEAFGTGVEGEQFMRIAESLQAGKIPLPVV
jgi:hypothetical protein